MTEVRLQQNRTGRGRPSKKQEREITESILEAATRLFLSEGYGATSMKRVGEAAGVAPNTLYLRYSNKASLFRALVEWKTEYWKTNMAPPRARAGAPLMEILEVAANHLIESTAREDVAAFGRLLTQESLQFPELSQIYYENAMILNRDTLMDRVRCASDCDLPDDKVLELIMCLTEMVVGHLAIRMFEGLSGMLIDREEVARRIARILAKSYGVPSKPHVGYT